MIGYSLSLCVADIAKGLVSESDVEQIVAGTKIETLAQLDEVLTTYRDFYWYDLPEASAIAVRLWNAGKVVQPRLSGAESHYIGTTLDGRWKSI